jgi:aryl-alcohol dehydrogenase-like predicted oxidoreductase
VSPDNRHRISEEVPRPKDKHNTVTASSTSECSPSHRFLDVGVFAEGIVEAVESGKVRAVGVANFNADQMRRIADHLARAGVALAANQVSYSLLRRAAETNGVLEPCRELDVALVAYFPLASGRLTQPSDSMGTKALLTCLADIAGAHDASIGQVALNWLLTRDSHVIPIPGARLSLITLGPISIHSVGA